MKRFALGLKDRVMAAYGLDNEVKDKWKEGFQRINYDESVFPPDKEAVIKKQLDLIFG